MYLSNNLISSSVLKPKVHLQMHPGVGFPGREEVEMDRLDNFAEETGKFNFINMDVQGYELEVLKGGVKLSSTLTMFIVKSIVMRFMKQCICGGVG